MLRKRGSEAEGEKYKRVRKGRINLMFIQYFCTSDEIIGFLKRFIPAMVTKGTLYKTVYENCNLLSGRGGLENYNERLIYIVFHRLKSSKRASAFELQLKVV